MVYFNQIANRVYVDSAINQMPARVVIKTSTETHTTIPMVPSVATSRHSGYIKLRIAPQEIPDN
jgi:hypothetical protein